jgi:hypothetical protein
LIRSAERALRWAIRRWAADEPFRAVVLLLVLEVLLGGYYGMFGMYGMVAVLIGLALASLRRLPGSRALRRVAARRWTAIALVGAVALLVSVGLSARRMPRPWNHDEHSHLLAADTFASGRLTNPTHPLWEHFESFHIIQQPTYASKYPPGQGLALAAGQVLTGHPIVGVWASFALACAATCWMLQGWTRPRWALLGGLLAALHPNFHGGAGRPGGIDGVSWTQSYRGGAVAMLGGALLFGALPRALQRPRAASGVVIGLGLTVLANSRPYEGLVASLPVGLALLSRLLRPGPYSARALAVRVLAPMSVVLGLAAAAMGYFNWRVTGRPLSMPYQVHERTYASVPTPSWGERKPLPEYRHEVMRRHYVDTDLALFNRVMTVPGYFQFYSLKLYRLLGFFVGPFIMPLLMLPVALRRSGPMRFAALTCLLVFATVLTAMGGFPYYVAPAVALYMLLVVQGFRHLSVLRLFGLRVGRVAAIVTLAFVVLSTALVLVYGVPISPEGEWTLDRERLEAQLESAGGKHLVIVRYATDHRPPREWVYNRADIDGAKVVWAREMGPARDAELLSHYWDRRAWLLEADATPLKLVPY